MSNKTERISIVIIIPYFGKWPFWMELFLASCSTNPTVQWLLFGDCGKPEKIPSNVTYQYISFNEYTKKVSDALGVNFSPENSYKLCDIKPMLGFIHEEDIKGFDFWAFGDLDLVYGDLREVYTERLLSKYDLISNHETRVSGHLCLIRNTKLMREIFKKVPDWKVKIINKEHLAFDEKAFSKLFVKHKNFPNWLRKFTNKIYPLVRRSCFVERYTTPNAGVAWEDGTFNFPEEWYWNADRKSVV